MLILIKKSICYNIALDYIYNILLLNDLIYFITTKINRKIAEAIKYLNNNKWFNVKKYLLMDNFCPHNCKLN